MKDIRYALRESPGKGVIKIICPFHEDTQPSMAVYDDGTYCFVCGGKETSEEFLKRLEFDGATLPDAEPRQRHKAGAGKGWVASSSLRAEVVAYNHILMDASSPRHHKVDWFVDRGIWRTTVKERLLGHTGTRFVIPVWYGDTLTGLRYRLDDEYHDEDTMKRSKYFNPPGQPGLLYRPNAGNGTIVVCEGELDALMLSQYGIDAVTSTNGADALHKEITPETMKCDWVFVATDLDKAGDKAYSRLCHTFGRTLPKLHWTAGKDISEALLAIDNPFKRAILEEWMEEAHEWQIRTGDD